MSSGLQSSQNAHGQFSHLNARQMVLGSRHKCAKGAERHAVTAGVGVAPEETIAAILAFLFTYTARVVCALPNACWHL
jgi:hypothetical protein